MDFKLISLDFMRTIATSGIAFILVLGAVLAVPINQLISEFFVKPDVAITVEGNAQEVVTIPEAGWYNISYLETPESSAYFTNPVGIGARETQKSVLAGISISVRKAESQTQIPLACAGKREIADYAERDRNHRFPVARLWASKPGRYVIESTFKPKTANRYQISLLPQGWSFLLPESVWQSKAIIFPGSPFQESMVQLTGCPASSVIPNNWLGDKLQIGKYHSQWLILPGQYLRATDLNAGEISAPQD